MYSRALKAHISLTQGFVWSIRVSAALSIILDVSSLIRVMIKNGMDGKIRYSRGLVALGLYRMLDVPMLALRYW